MTALLTALLLCTAADPAPADLGKLGPLSRKVTKEKEGKRGVEALYKGLEAALKKGDIAAYAELIDFPVLLISDKADGSVVTATLERDDFVRLMGPYMAAPRDVKRTHKHSVQLLSDSLASVEEENAMSAGKVKGAWRAQALVVQREGRWRFKTLVEAGWGELAAQAPAVKK